MIKVNADMVHLIDSEKGETMKKSKFVAVAVLSVLAVGAGTLASCGGETEDNIINIQFVPSNDPTKLATLAKHMEPMLHEIEPNYEFKITTGTTYAATTTAMLADQVDIGFLTASGYAEVTLKNPGKVEVLMTSVRDGYKVQEDYKTEEEQRAAMNGEVAGYEYLGQQSESKVNWYTSQLVVANQYYVDANKDGKIDILDMAGLTVGRMGSTSGAGYLRPLKYLHDHGMEMVDEITDATKQIKGIDYGSAGYSAACQAMMDGDVAGFWGYTDVRYSNFYSKTDSEHYQDKKLFTDYKVIAITDGIYNDTISARSNLSDAKKEAVKRAFKELVKDGSKDEEGTGAYYLYNLYSHTGYTDAKDSDFQGERDFYQFCVDNGIIK